MPYEWLLVALPVAFALGWAAARLDIRHIKKSAAELPRACMRGLSELMQGNEEKALDTFSGIASEETLPSELQFTVGELSRRRGDYRRALSTHQRLHTDEKLSEADRNRALWELANDCAAMGFLDAAEQHARQLAETEGYRERVFDFLLHNYQMRRRYQEALHLITGASQAVQQLHQKTAAQLCCQLAQNKPPDAATDLLNRALTINPACVSARLELAQLALAAQPPATAAALTHIAAIAAAAPQHLWQAADSLLRAYTLAGDAAAGRAALLHWLRDTPSPMLYKKAIALLEEQLHAASGEEQAHLSTCLQQVVDEFLLTGGSMEAAVHFIEQRVSEGEQQKWLAVKKTLLAACGRDFVCTHCRYEMNRFAWQCPCCLRWESFAQQ